MKKGREIRNLPVITVASGKVLGFLEDLLIGVDQKIEGLFIRLESKEIRLIPIEQMVNLGRDAVLVHGEEEDFALVAEPYNNILPVGAWVMTAEGKSLGTIDDIVVEENAGGIVGYEISDGFVMDMLVGRKIITASNILTYGQETVIVDEDF